MKNKLIITVVFVLGTIYTYSTGCFPVTNIVGKILFSLVGGVLISALFVSVCVLLFACNIILEIISNKK